MKVNKKKEPASPGDKPVKKQKPEKQILNSGLSELELLKIKVSKIEEAVNKLLEQSGLRPIEEQENTAGPRPIKYGD